MSKQGQIPLPAVFAADNGAVLFLNAGSGIERIILHGGEVINFDPPVSDVVTIREIAEDAGGAAQDRCEGVNPDQVMGECYVEAGANCDLHAILGRLGFHRIDDMP